jgi:Na+/melibiose symporter-like transporter
MKKASIMFLFYFSVGLAIASTLLYHVTQKLTPSDVNPALALIVTYATSLVVCALLSPLFPWGRASGQPWAG